MQRNSNGVPEQFFDPQNVGEAAEPNFIGRSGSFQCGAILRISLHIDGSQRIIEAKFKAAITDEQGKVATLTKENETLKAAVEAEKNRANETISGQGLSTEKVPAASHGF